MAGERLSSTGDGDNIKLRLIGRRDRDGRQHNLPTSSEVVAFIVGDFDSFKNKRDIILHKHSGSTKRISELHVSYLPLQYPLLLAYAEDGYRTDIYHRGVTDFTPTNRKTRVSMREWLFQQFMVDGYTMVESERMTFIRIKQKELRYETYTRLASLASTSDGSRVVHRKKYVLPATFTGSPRYMLQNYLDDMSICKFYGYTDPFITFTCNASWPKISRYMAEKGLKSEDRPDATTRVFKKKLVYLMKVFRDRRTFGRVKGGPDLYKLMTKNMMHGQCGLEHQNFPCMVNNRCTKKFSKPFNEETFIDDNGYAIYKRLDNGMTVKKSGTNLDNGFVVPYNPGSDRVTAAVDDEEVDEIKDYYECRSLKTMDHMPYPNAQYTMEGYNRLVNDEINYNRPELSDLHHKLYQSLTDEQNYIYANILDAIEQDKGGKIVLNVASSGIAALLLDRGRTAHSRFAIPINVVKDSMCSISADSDLADFGVIDLLCQTNLITWDEALILNKQCFEAFDRTMRDICRTKNNEPFDRVFGGKVVVFGGDFRQILPVISTVNMRLKYGTNNDEIRETKEFVDWILDIGNGKIREKNNGESTLEFLEEMLILDSKKHERAILAPIHGMVDVINKSMLAQIPGEEKVYLSVDTVSLADDASEFVEDAYTLEFLNNIKMSGVPHHELALKVGAPVMCMRNIDQRDGLCNGTRLQITRMGTNVIEAKIISRDEQEVILAIKSAKEHWKEDALLRDYEDESEYETEDAPEYESGNDSFE
ncbi:putative PIF1 DNA helicase/replication protein A1-like protein [Tanacetum coccineum]